MQKTAQTKFPIHELLAKRWSPRAFAQHPVERDRLASLLEAARWAPSSYNEQPWAFILATKDNQEEHERLLSCLIKFNRQWAKSAPALILTVAKLFFDKTQQENRHAFHDVGLAAAFLVTQATALGLFAHQMAGIEPEKARELYDIPEGWEAVTAIALGYLGEPNSLPEKMRATELAPRTRKALSDFVYTSRWGHTPPFVGSF